MQLNQAGDQTDQEYIQCLIKLSKEVSRVTIHQQTEGQKDIVMKKDRLDHRLIIMIILLEDRNQDHLMIAEAQGLRHHRGHGILGRPAVAAEVSVEVLDHQDHLEAAVVVDHQEVADQDAEDNSTKICYKY